MAKCRSQPVNLPSALNEPPKISPTKSTRVFLLLLFYCKFIGPPSDLTGIQSDLHKLTTLLSYVNLLVAGLEIATNTVANAISFFSLATEIIVV